VKYASDLLQISGLSSDVNIKDLYINFSGNFNLGNIGVVEMLTCLTSNIQDVWPGTQLTLNTPNVFDCQPAVSLTIAQFFGLSNAMTTFYNATTDQYRTDLFENANAIQTEFNGIVDSRWISTVPSASTYVSNFSYYILLSFPRDFSTTIGTLVANDVSLRSTMAQSLLDMLVTDFFVCLTQTAPWLSIPMRS
jgi:hypothetical protein